MRATDSSATTSAAPSPRSRATCRGRRKRLESSAATCTAKCVRSGSCRPAASMATKKSSESARVSQSVLQDLIGTKTGELQVHVPRLRERGGRDEADDLAFEDRDAVACGFALDGLEYLEHRRVLVVREVHGHLDEPAMSEPEPRGLDILEPTTAFADARRDGSRDIDPVSVEVDVVGNQRTTCADDRCAPRGMRRAWSEVGHPRSRCHPHGEPLQSSAPDILETSSGG